MGILSRQRRSRNVTIKYESRSNPDSPVHSTPMSEVVMDAEPVDDRLALIRSSEVTPVSTGGWRKPIPTTQYMLEVVRDGQLVDEPPRTSIALESPMSLEPNYLPSLRDLLDLSERIGTSPELALRTNIVPDALPSDTIELSPSRSLATRPEFDYHRIERTSVTECYSETTVTTPYSTTRETRYTRYSS